MPLTYIAEGPGRMLRYEGMMADAALGTRSDTMSARKAARFPRTSRLLRHADFERVYKQGRRHFSASMTVFYWARPEVTTASETRAGACPELVEGVPAPQVQAHGLRVGFTVGRVLGGAVHRNRMKRRLREAVRMSLPPADIAADVVINPKKSLLAADFEDVLNEVRRAFEVIEHKLSGNGKTRAAAPAPHGT